MHTHTNHWEENLVAICNHQADMSLNNTNSGKLFRIYLQTFIISNLPWKLLSLYQANTNESHKRLIKTEALLYIQEMHISYTKYMLSKDTATFLKTESVFWVLSVSIQTRMLTIPCCYKHIMGLPYYERLINTCLTLHVCTIDYAQDELCNTLLLLRNGKTGSILRTFIFI